MDVVLAEAVLERLEQRWSPAAIAADLRMWGQRVCAETIYRACYNSASVGLLSLRVNVGWGVVEVLV